MKELVERAATAGDQFEVFSINSRQWSMKFDKTGFRDIESSLSSGSSLRLIKDGRIGFSYGNSMRRPQMFVDSALLSLKAGPRVTFSFRNDALPPTPRAWDSGSEQVTPEAVSDAMSSAYEYMSSRCGGDVTVFAGCKRVERRISNSAGLDVSWKSSQVDFYVLLQSSSGDWLESGRAGLSSACMVPADMDVMLERFALLGHDIKPASGRQKVLFMPEAMYVILWRLNTASSAKTLLENASPLAGREGTEVLSPLLTVRSNPLDSSFPGARPVDDEGVPCRDFVMFEKGIFKGYYTDLFCAGKLGIAPTGHGYRRTMWGGDPLSLKPVPSHYRSCFDPGDKDFSALLREMGEGIVVFGALGAHSANIQNGDFSIGVGPGFVVREGRLAGRASGAVVSGNVYDVLRRTIAVGSDRYACGDNNPPLLLDGVDVSA